MSQFPFELERYRIQDNDRLVQVVTFAIDFELYQIVCRDLEDGAEKPIGALIVGIENIAARFQQAIDALSGAYIFPDWEDK